MFQSSTSSARSERWKREDDAPRLADDVPALISLRLELAEWSQGRKVLDSERVRHIIVERAGARFEVPCGDPRCEDGGHDLTRGLLTELKACRQSFADRDRCGGYVGDRPCGRFLSYTVHAEFKAPAVKR